MVTIRIGGLLGDCCVSYALSLLERKATLVLQLGRDWPLKVGLAYSSRRVVGTEGMSPAFSAARRHSRTEESASSWRAARAPSHASDRRSLACPARSGFVAVTSTSRTLEAGSALQFAVRRLHRQCFIVVIHVGHRHSQWVELLDQAQQLQRQGSLRMSGPQLFGLSGRRNGCRHAGFCTHRQHGKNPSRKPATEKRDRSPFSRCDPSHCIRYYTMPPRVR